jgi:hypothetical protein
MLSVLKQWFGPALGRIDSADWLRLQAIASGDLRAYRADDVRGTGYRVFEWGNGRHTRPTNARRVAAE